MPTATSESIRCIFNYLGALRDHDAGRTRFSRHAREDARRPEPGTSGGRRPPLPTVNVQLITLRLQERIGDAKQVREGYPLLIRRPPHPRALRRPHRRGR